MTSRLTTWKRLASIFLFLLLASFTIVPLSAQAATCTCFCATTEGAKEFGDFSKASECQEKCTESNFTMVTCASSYAEYPSRNPRCFTQEQCSNAIKEHLDKSISNTGDVFSKGSFSLDQRPSYQPPECLPGEGYCYPPQREYVLGVALGQVQTVQGIAGYVNQAYKYLLGISVTISIVMVMIGGVQYVLGGASSEQVSKAKARISNAVVGLVLLLSAYVILYTVNPNLVSLRVPTLPLVKKVVLVEEESCEALKEKGFEIGQGEEVQDLFTGEPNAEERCGSTTIVKADDKGQPVADGTTCDFSDCSDEGEGKSCYTSENEAKCISCTEVYGAGVVSSGSELAPSEEVCSALTLPDEDTNGDPPQPVKRNYCFYTHDPAVIISGWDYAALASVPLTGGLTVGVAAGVTEDTVAQSVNGTCAQIELDCTRITSCNDYGDQKVSSAFTENEVKDLAIGGSLGSPVNFQTLCQTDPCKAAEKEGKTRCVFGNLNTSLFGYQIYSQAACIGQ